MPNTDNSLSNDEFSELLDNYCQQQYKKSLNDYIQNLIDKAVQPLIQHIDALQQQLQYLQHSPQQQHKSYNTSDINRISNDMSTMNLHSDPSSLAQRRLSLSRSQSGGGSSGISSNASSSSSSSSTTASTGDQLDNISDIDPRMVLNSRLKTRVSTADSTMESNLGISPVQRKMNLTNKSGLSADGHSIHQLGINSNINNITSPQTRQRGSVNGQGPELILVEDVRVSAKIASAALTRAHYKVVIASDGESAVEQYKQNINTVRVILMDINLPGISGIEATQQIRQLEKQHNGSPVLIYGLTGNVEEENMRQYQQCGMNGCIIKGKLLVNAVSQAIQISERNPNEFVNLANEKYVANESKSNNDEQSQQSSSTQQQQQQHQPALQNNPRYVPDTPTHTPLPDDPLRQTDAVSPQSSMSTIQTQQQQSPLQQLPKRINTPPTQTQSISSQSQSQSQSQSTNLSSAPSFSLNRSLSTGGGSNADLLLVEDVRVSARIAQQSLTRANYRVDVASDGESAVQKFKSHSNNIRIILMDINLPGISGIEATEQIRRYERDNNITNNVIIFGLTGNVDEDNLRLYQQSGMNGCIVKGKLLPDAVQQGVKQIQLNPTTFVNLASQNAFSNNQSPSSATPQQHQSSSTATGNIQQRPPSSSSNNRSIQSIRNESTTYDNSVIGTPRATQPRQLLADRFQGRGINRPGVGLGNSSSGGSTLPNALGERYSPTNTLQSQSQSQSHSLSQQQSIGGNGPQLLLVEDVRVSQKIAQSALQRAHYKVIVASDGESAVEQFKQYWHTLHIILMDINLPGISGIEATEKIRQYESTLQSQHMDYRPILIYGLTGNVEEENLKLYEAAGMNGCIMKGKVLADSVKEAERQSEINPNNFVNLVQQN